MKKRLCAILLAMTVSLSLTACGGADTQPAIDAFNSASNAYEVVANQVNADSEAFSEELIASLNEVADSMFEYKDILESGEELTEEQVTEMIQVFEEVEAWAIETNENIDEFKVSGADKQPAIDAFNQTSTAFNAVAEAINADLESYPSEIIDVMNEMSTSLTAIGELLSGDDILTEELVQELVDQLTDIEAWVASAEELLVTQ